MDYRKNPKPRPQPSYLDESINFRVESKINKAMKERLSTRAKAYTQDKIDSLHRMLQEAETETSTLPTFSETRVSDPITLLNDKELEYMDKIGKMKTKIKTLELELHDAQQTTAHLKSVFDKERTQNRETLEQMTERHERMMKNSTGDLEESLRGQQDMIENLLKNKKQLTSQVHSLMKQLKLLDSKYSKVSSDFKEKFRAELKSAKEQWAANEKLKRDKWMDKKAKEIKDTTIKGLEPEIERMLSQGREDKRKVEENYKDRIRDERMRLEELMETKIRETKDRLILDNERVINNERDFLQETYQKMELETRKKHEEDLDRLKVIQKKEVERIDELYQKEKGYLSSKVEELRRQNDELEMSLKQEQTSEIQKTRETHRQELERRINDFGDQKKDLEERLRMEISMEYKNREENLKKKMLDERDEQIEFIVQKMTEEHMKGGSQESERLRANMKSMNTDFSKERDDLGLELSIYKDKLVEEQRRTSQQEKQILQLQKKCRDLEMEIEEKERFVSRTKLDVKGQEEILDIQRQQFISERKALEGLLHSEKIKTEKLMEEQYRRELEIKRGCEDDLGRRDERHMQELEDIEGRVKKVIVMKENEIRNLKQELQIKVGLCQKYEELLGRERQQLLSRLQLNKVQLNLKSIIDQILSPFFRQSYELYHILFFFLKRQQICLFYS